MPPNSQQVREIRVVVSGDAANQLKAIANSMGLLNKATSGLTGLIGNLRNAFIGYYAALKVGEIVRLSDEMQNLYNRIKILSGGTTEADQILNGLLQRANATKSSISDLASSFAQLQATTRDTNISSKLLLDLTQVLQNTFRLSGTSAELAAAGTLQLSQGLALGVLRGQDLRSVLQSNVVAGDLLAKQLGITRAEVYKFAESGKITNKEVFGAFLNNQDEVNEKAKQLAPTFSQTLTTALNDFRFAIFQLNKEFDLSGKFATGIDMVKEKFTLVVAVLGVVALTAIPAAITAFEALSISIYGLGLALSTAALSNPFTAALLAISAVALIVSKNLADLESKVLTLTAGLLTFADAALRTFKAFAIGSRAFTDETFIEKAAVSLLEMRNELDKPVTSNNFLSSSKDEIKKFLDGLKTAKSKTKELKVRDLLADLNAQYIKGNIVASEYFDRLNNFSLDKLNLQFKQGRIDLKQLEQGFVDARRELIVRDFAEGGQSLARFNENIRKLDISELQLKLRLGTISFQEYNEQLLKLQQGFDFQSSTVFGVGLQNYLNQAGTFATGIAGAITETFKRLEDSFVDFIKTGKFNFTQFASGILEDLNRIIVRAAIIAPLAKGLLNFVGPSGRTNVSADNFDFSDTAAKGAAYDNGFKKFAVGGVVSSPTPFMFGGNKLGLMGEAGTEAILPLKRGKNGDLGVQAGNSTPVQVNVYNSNGGQVETKESTGPNGQQIIDVIIKQKMAENISNGSMDKLFKNSYGLQRKGN